MMHRMLKLLYFAAGAACTGYYFLLGHASRFGLSMAWMWPVLGAAFIASGALCDRPFPRWLRWGWRGGILLGMVWLTALLCPVVSGMTQSAPANMDYLIVLGARVEQDGPSPALTRRLNAAMAYLENSPDTLVIASGGQGSDEPVSEAECIRSELIRRGIAPERILIEDKSTDTMQNIAYSMALMDDHSKSAGIVTNNFHVWRAERLAKAAGLENARGIAAQYTGYTLFHYMVREVICITVEFLRGNL